jgi:hypothetical protein
MRRTHMPTWNAMAPLAVAALLISGSSAAIAASADLTFSGDASFQGAHGDQPIHVAVVTGGEVVAEESGTVSASDDPSFSFTFPGVLEEGQSYEVHYWIDSNFGGGSEGTCDPKEQDHQWNVSLGTVEGDVSHTEQHRPGETGDVCETFM